MELGLWMLVYGKLELGLVVEEGCFDLAPANAVVGLPAPDTPACLTLGALEEKWGVGLVKNDVDSEIEVVGGEHLPVVQRALRGQRWARLGQRRDPTAVEEVEAAVESRPEISLSGSVDTANGRGTQTGRIRTALGPGTFELTAVDTTDRGLTRVRTAWSSVGGSHRVKVGDAIIQPNHLTNAERGRGVELELGKRGRRAGYYTRDLVGDRPSAEYSVELYLNGVLIDYLPAGDPEWEFKSVPQPGRIAVKFYGPTGEEITETFGSSGRGSTLPPGRVSLQLGAVQADAPVWTTKDTPDGPDRGDVAVRGEVQHGLATGLTLTGSYRHLPQGQRITGVGVVSDYGRAEVVLDDQRRVALVGDARLGDLSIEHEHRAEGFNSNRRRGLEDRTEARLHQRVGPVTLRPSITREAWYTGRETYDLELDASVYAGRTSFRLDTTLRHDDDAGWIAPTIRPSFRWRGGLTEAVGAASVSADTPYDFTLSSSLRHRLTNTESASVSGSWSRDAWRATPSISSAEIDGWRASLAAPIDSTGTIGVMLSFSTTISFDDRWEVRPDARGAKAFVVVGVYEDRDGDGHWDVDEAGIEGVPVRQVGETDRDGYAKAWLSPGREIIVDLSVEDLYDPRHHPTAPVAFTIRPGAANRLDVPVRYVEMDRS